MQSVLDRSYWDLEHLTPAEEIWLWRMRWRTRSDRRIGQIGAAASFAEAAALLGMSETHYRQLESGARDATSVLQELGHPVPSEGELCRLARRRAGIQVRKVEDDLLISRPVLHAAEGHGQKAQEGWAAAARRRLVEYWEEHGFRFPPR